MDTGQPLRPITPPPPPVEAWPAPALGTLAPGNIAPHPPEATAAPPAAASTAGAVPAPPAPNPADEARMARAMFRDGQRLLYYSIQFPHFVTADRVYGHGQIYESLLAVALVRMHSGLERLVRAQMPMARPVVSTSEGDYAVEWRDLLLYLQSARRIMPADKSFLSDTTGLRNRLVHGEIVTIDPHVLIRLSELGMAIFAQLDPDYQRPDHDPRKDALPVSHALHERLVVPPPASDEEPPAGFLTPLPGATPPAAHAHPHASNAAPPAPMLHSATLPTERMEAVGVQRSGIAPHASETEHCYRCERPVRPDDRWCPRCGEDLQGTRSYHPAPAQGYGARGPAPTRGARDIFNRFLGGRPRSR